MVSAQLSMKTFYNLGTWFVLYLVKTIRRQGLSCRGPIFYFMTKLGRSGLKNCLLGRKAYALNFMTMLYKI